MTKEKENTVENAENEAAKETTCTEKEAATEKTAKSEKVSKRELEAEVIALRESAEKAAKALAESEDKYLRILAEYDNYRKRTVKEKEGIYSDAYGEALKALLPVADNLELAVRYDQGDKVVEGVKMVLNQLHDALGKMGIEEIETKTFDPNVHNAVMHTEDDAYGEGEIVEVFQKGYRKGDKIIRYAMVKVAN